MHSDRQKRCYATQSFWRLVMRSVGPEKGEKELRYGERQAMSKYSGSGEK